ncbi:hypothetical protein [Paraburkholderia bannensis]|uniref:hypothetical protein n=1 Tax=Paraburkholderia bannensis TaxID=765414 RepID=UPI0012EC0850|nr:hypothetical protein [Paraburkholderia bannensis]
MAISLGQSARQFPFVYVCGAGEPFIPADSAAVVRMTQGRGSAARPAQPQTESALLFPRKGVPLQFQPAGIDLGTSPFTPRLAGRFQADVRGVDLMNLASSTRP